MDAGYPSAVERSRSEGWKRKFASPPEREDSVQDWNQQCKREKEQEQTTPAPYSSPFLTQMEHSAPINSVQLKQWFCANLTSRQNLSPVEKWALLFSDGHLPACPWLTHNQQHHQQ